jgi:hypothetical protein
MKRAFLSAALILSLLGICGGCGQSSKPVRDINAVLADHSKSLMAEPGVVGVYVGLMPDEKTPCLKVMIKDRAAAARAKIPNELEGHPVVKEETGEIKALHSKATQ